MPSVRTSRSMTDASPEVGGEEPEEDLDERALARAVGADEPDDPGLEVESQAVEGGDAARIPAGQVTKGDEAHARQSLPCDHRPLPADGDADDDLDDQGDREDEREHRVARLVVEAKEADPATDRAADDGEGVQDELRDPPAAAARLRLVDGVGGEGDDGPRRQPGEIGAGRPGPGRGRRTAPARLPRVR